jgi:hypothetical protein
MSSSLSTSELIGIILGGVLGLATIVGIAVSIYALCCKKNPKQNDVQPYNNQQYPPQQGPYGQPVNNGFYGQQPQYPQYNNQPAPAYAAANTKPNYNL